MITGDTTAIRSGMGNYIYHVTMRLKEKKPDLFTAIAFRKNKTFDDLPVEVPWYPFSKYSFVFWSQFVSLQKRMFEKYDIIHNPAHFPVMNKLGRKYVCTIHDLTPLIYPQWHPRWRSLYSRIAFPRLMANADQIIADSFHTKMDIVRHYRMPEHKITVVHLGAAPEYRPLEDRQIASVREKYHLDRPFVLFVGNLEIRKNIPTLLRSFYRCRKKISELSLVIAGRKGWLYHEIFSTLANLKLEKDVIFLDYVPHEDLPALYNAAELFVYIPYYEGFGLPVLEAMQCGTPVITSNTSSLPEIMGREEFMVDPFDEKALSELICRMVTDERFRNDAISHNLSRCTMFSWEKCAQMTYKVYEEL